MALSEHEREVLSELEAQFGAQDGNATRPSHARRVIGWLGGRDAGSVPASIPWIAFVAGLSITIVFIGTIAVSFLGCVLMGWAMYLLAKRAASPSVSDRLRFLDLRDRARRALGLDHDDG